MLLTFLLVFQADSYQYWGDKYHAVLSSQVLFGKIPGESLARPLWRDDVLAGNIWLVSLGTIPFMVDTAAARVFQLSPFAIDLLSNGLGYIVATGSMLWYLRHVLALSESSASVGAILFAASGYILSVWTGCANDWWATGLLPALLVGAHRLMRVLEAGGSGRFLMSWAWLTLLVYVSAASSSIKTLPILLGLVMAYGAFVFRTIRSVAWIASAVGVGLCLYAPWLWLYWDAARISQRMASSFTPPVSFAPQDLLGQCFVVLKRIVTGFNVYGVSISAVLIVLVSIATRRVFFTHTSPHVKSILRFSMLALLVCFAMDTFALQVNDLKREVPLAKGFDVVRFEWFASFFALVPVAWLLDRGLLGPEGQPFASEDVRRVRKALVVGAGLFMAQALHHGVRTSDVLASVYPQGLVVGGYVVLWLILTASAFVLLYRGIGERWPAYRRWALGCLALSVLFQASAIGYRHGIELSNRATGDEPIMTYAERFKVPEDLRFLKEINVEDHRVVDLTRPYDRVLTTAASTVLPWAGLRTPVGYGNLFPKWYDQFVAQGINGGRQQASRWVEIQPSPRANLNALKLLDVSYVLAYAGSDLPGYMPLHRHEPTGKIVYAAGTETAAAFLSPGLACASTDQEALEMIHAADFPLLELRAILVSTDPTAQLFCRDQFLSGASAGPQPSRPAQISVRRGPDRVNLEIQSQSGGILTLADTYYPGWRAYLDGVEVPILRTYTTLRGIALQPGHHAVEFVFSPQAFMTLFRLSMGLLLLLLVSVAWVVWRQRRSAVPSCVKKVYVHE